MVGCWWWWLIICLMRSCSFPSQNSTLVQLAVEPDSGICSSPFLFLFDVDQHLSTLGFFTFLLFSSEVVSSTPLSCHVAAYNWYSFLASFSFGQLLRLTACLSSTSDPAASIPLALVYVVLGLEPMALCMLLGKIYQTSDFPSPVANNSLCNVHTLNVARLSHQRPPHRHS